MKNDADTERYKELVRIAPAQSIELVHEEAFGRLTPEQRDEMVEVLSDSARTPEEKPADASPAALAAAATNQESERPGSLGRLFGGRGDETDVGSSLFATFVAYAIGSELSFALLASTPFPDAGGDPGDEDGSPDFINPGFDGIDGGF